MKASATAKTTTASHTATWALRGTDRSITATSGSGEVC